MNWIIVTRWIITLGIIILSGWYLWTTKKESPQDLVNRRLLAIEMWIIASFIVMATEKITIVIAL